MDRSGAARAPLSVRWWNEAGPAAGGVDETDAAAGPVGAVHRRGRGAWRDGTDSPRTPAHSAGPDTAGRRPAGDHHDRRDGADPTGGGPPCGVRRPPPLGQARAELK